MAKFRKGANVQWNWGAGTGSGKVEKSFTERVSRTIKGSEIVRDASPENPAYLIETEAGDRVLKSHSELTKV